MSLETRNIEFKSQGKIEQGTAHRGDIFSYVKCASLAAVKRKHNCNGRGGGEVEG
jgi:hypothetical protein